MLKELKIFYDENIDIIKREKKKDKNNPFNNTKMCINCGSDENLTLTDTKGIYICEECKFKLI